MPVWTFKAFQGRPSSVELDALRRRHGVGRGRALRLNTPRGWTTDRWIALARFAEDNALDFHPELPTPAYPGAVFNQGHSRTCFDVVRCLDGAFAEAGQAMYVTGSSYQEQHSRYYAVLRLPRMLPPLLALRRDSFGKVSDLPVVPAWAPLPAGGRSPEGFVLHAMRGAPSPTPAVLDALGQVPDGFDVEVVQDWLFLYAERLRLADEGTWRDFARVADEVVPRIIG